MRYNIFVGTYAKIFNYYICVSQYKILNVCKRSPFEVYHVLHMINFELDVNMRPTRVNVSHFHLHIFLIAVNCKI